MPKPHLLLIVFSLTYLSCKQPGFYRNESHKQVAKESIEAGEQLAKQYCQSCHMLPQPDWASSASWEKGILPNMGPRFGIFKFNGKTYPVTRFEEGLSPYFYPSQPTISTDQWQKIIDYFTATSPDTVTTKQQRDAPIIVSLPQFEVSLPSRSKPNPPVTCMVVFDSANAAAPIITADAFGNKLYRYNTNLEITDSVKTPSPVLQLSRSGNNWISTNVGVLNPNSGSYGTANLVAISGRSMQIDTPLLLRDMKRPVSVKAADLNGDGKEDFLACEFGYREGALSWFENNGNKQFTRHVLRPLPGAITAYFNDYNHDGLTDIWALFAQGEEGIFVYTNKGNGRFEEKQVLRFPSIYGSSYFEFADFNKDGYPDIVYTCGDNADYSLQLKPYHGVYIFLNDGKWNFQQKFFYPINGCYKAMARDFDQDGDLDIATIAYFADYKNQPEEGFVYFNNKGNMQFQPSSTKEIFQGRWLTMDVGDIDRDGDEDIILGNFSVAPSFIQSGYDWKKGPAILVLKNTLHKKQ